MVPSRVFETPPGGSAKCTCGEEFRSSEGRRRPEVSCARPLASGQYTLSQLGRRRPLWRAEQQTGIHSGDVHYKVDAIDERPSYPGLVPSHLCGRAGTRATVVARETARTRIRRSYESEPGGESKAPVGAYQGDESVFERLTQGLQGRWAELGHLVQEQDAVVSQ